MSARKLQQEIDKEFKRVAEGIQQFDGIFDKLNQSTNPSQREKLEDSLKKEIKKLQRSRDKIKGWASQNDIKDKKPLLDQRKLIETKMETFKAVEKEMKTKAYSKEGLNAAAKLDPKDKEKLEVCQFVSDMVDALAQQIESTEAEAEQLQVGLKKSKKDNSKAERLSELERVVERHKWHSTKLEILLRSLENGSVEVEQVKEIEEGIKYYVEQNQEVDFMEDDTIYDDLNLDEDEELYGMAAENDKLSSQDAQSIQDEPPDIEAPIRTNSHGTGKVTKPANVTDAASGGRRSSTQMKTPLPALSTLQSSSNTKQPAGMKEAPVPAPPTGTLKYASAAAAAAASDKSGVGIAPLPPPPGTKAASSETVSPAPLPAQPAATVSSPSPSQNVVQPAKSPEEPPKKQPTPAPKEEARGEEAESTRPKVPLKPSPQDLPAEMAQTQQRSTEAVPPKTTQPPSPDSGVAGIALSHSEPAQEEEEEEEQSIYHLPSSLTDLLDSFEETRERARSDRPIDSQLLSSSRLNCPPPSDAAKPLHYSPQTPYLYTPSHYPQTPLSIFDDPRLYSRLDTDSLFYAFYYRQGTYQQYLAAKALKQQSWRFHKQYQTWFQRHEEPKNITEEFEQGTYRFFDYESTWMNRRKADFKFAYKFLEDDL